MSRTVRNVKNICNNGGFRKCKTFRNLRAEQAGAEALIEEGFAEEVTNRVSARSNKWGGHHPNRDDREVAAIREIPASVRGW